MFVVQIKRRLWLWEGARVDRKPLSALVRIRPRGDIALCRRLPIILLALGRQLSSCAV